MKKLISFRIFRKYCHYRGPVINSCCMWKNNNGKCTEKSCPIFSKLKPQPTTGKRIEVMGWVGRTELKKKKIWEWFDGVNDYLLKVFKHKGSKIDYDRADWPPVKVKVTIEEVK